MRRSAATLVAVAMLGGCQSFDESSRTGSGDTAMSAPSGGTSAPSAPSHGSDGGRPYRPRPASSAFCQSHDRLRPLESNARYHEDAAPPAEAGSTARKMPGDAQADEKPASLPDLKETTPDAPAKVEAPAADDAEHRLARHAEEKPEAKAKAAPEPFPLDQPALAPAAAMPKDVRMSKSKRLIINYEVSDAGAAGPCGVDLWCTHDGKDWEKVDLGAQHGSPYVVEVADEGLYGITLVARTESGVGREGPKAGEQPQLWTEVDVTRPVVKLQTIEEEFGPDFHYINILWTARDRNLGERPITLSYAEKADGPWTPFVSGVENTGRYQLKMLPDLPPRFYLRVEAADRAGNVGTDQSPQAISADGSQPKVSIVSVVPMDPGAAPAEEPAEVLAPIVIGKKPGKSTPEVLHGGAEAPATKEQVLPDLGNGEAK